ncbi:hypothetical protein F4808DRAFT_441727 [Astrocystis sublimbata]|nr:hypothetical protein F4808DRAFT_441727 [Astrocystis sublimbata]
MGAAISTVIHQLLEATDADASIKREQLELMLKLADARLDTFQAELEKTFLDRESASVPGRRALRFERHVNVDAESTPGKGVEDAIDAFLGTGTKGAALDGFKAVVKTGLSAILGDASAGESYDKKFFVCVKHNAIIRVDMYTYKYTFASQGVVDVHKNILAYILCISVVDHKDVTQDELTYLASEFAGDGDVGPGSDFDMYLETIMKTWTALRAVEYPTSMAWPLTGA